MTEANRGEVGVAASGSNLLKADAGVREPALRATFPLTSIAMRLRRGRAGFRRGGSRTRAGRVARRVAAVIGLLGALAAGGWIWLRDSSLASVDQVQIVGAGGPQGTQIRSALELAARNMTTLDVHLSALRSAVAPYPSVARIRVSTSFPHTMRIVVHERRAVAVLKAAGTSVMVADDGTVLRDQTVDASLPTIVLRSVPSGSRVRGVALSEVRLLSVAPAALSARVSQVSSDSVHGLIAQLRNGPRIYFGDGGVLSAKWSSAGAVLAQPDSAGAQYIDVTVPARPAAGVGNDAPGQH